MVDIAFAPATIAIFADTDVAVLLGHCGALHGGLIGRRLTRPSCELSYG
jgi:hypothetical protein